MYPFRNIFKQANLTVLCHRQLHISPALNLFYEKDAKGGYRQEFPMPLKDRVRLGLQELKKEIALWTQEMKEHFESDPIMICRPGETDIAWKFSNEESLQKWILSCDSDHGEGYSNCKLELNKQGMGVFSGELSTRVPKDGKVKRAGYCNIKTIDALKSFKRETYLNWTSYNTLVIRTRGDGRSYLINIHSKGYFDSFWYDVYHYVLYTRGGPYWQVTRIPFSKFMLSSKGRVQDRQNPLPLSKVTSFGISVGDKINGPFHLEVDYIGLEFDPNHREEFAYELYQFNKNIAQN